jgi:GntR family transcriptional regulator, rspAB operon transcriptional repressor
MRRLRRGKTTSLRDQVGNILRDEILTGRLQPGAILNERTLAERLGVSKTPVREALTLLGHEGLVHTLPRKGYFVSAISIQDVHDFFGLRVILESAAASAAAAKITDEQLEDLEKLAVKGDSVETPSEQLDQNIRFHDYVASLSGNARLAALIRKLHLEMQRMIAAGYLTHEHEKLLSAFRQREPERAAEAMQEHIRTIRDKVLRVALAGSQGSD